MSTLNRWLQQNSKNSFEQQCQQLANLLRVKEQALETTSHELKVKTAAMQMLEQKIMSSETLFTSTQRELASAQQDLTSTQRDLASAQRELASTMGALQTLERSPFSRLRERLPSLPDVPVLAESPGFNGFEILAWTGLRPDPGGQDGVGDTLVGQHAFDAAFDFHRRSGAGHADRPEVARSDRHRHRPSLPRRQAGEGSARHRLPPRSRRGA